MSDADKGIAEDIHSFRTFGSGKIRDKQCFPGVEKQSRLGTLKGQFEESDRLQTDIAHSLHVQPSNHLIGDAAGLTEITVLPAPDTP